MPHLHELRVFQAAMDLSTAVYRLTLDEPLARHFGLVNQLRCAAVSIPSNIAEGYGLATRAQLIRGLRIALGSARELEVQLEIVGRLCLAEKETLAALAGRSHAVIGMLVNMLKSLGSKPTP
jgi:four helix bundle protein